MQNLPEHSENKPDSLGAIGEIDSAPLMRVNAYYPSDNPPPAHSHLYAISTGPYIKVGLAVDPNRRLSNLQTACPYPLELHCTRRVPYLLRLSAEKRIHAALRERRHAGEWFSATAEEVAPLIKRAARMASYQWRYGKYVEPGSGRVTVPQ